MTATPSTAGRSSAMRLIWFVLPALAVGYQYAAKSVALAAPPKLSAGWLAAVAISPWTWVMLALELASFIAWMRVLAVLKLSEAFPLSAVSYVLVIAMAWLQFGEAPSPGQVVGGAAIMAGIWLIGREP